MEEDDEVDEDKNKVVGKKRSFKTGFSLDTIDKDDFEDDDDEQEYVPLATLKKMRALDDKKDDKIKVQEKDVKVQAKVQAKVEVEVEDDDNDDDDVELKEDKVLNIE